MPLERSLAANNKEHFLRALRKEHRGLASGVAAASDDDGRASAERAFKGGGGIVNASAFKVLASFASMRL